VRVFVLGTGRTGSTTFARACRHITNHTAAHESRIDVVEGRLDYPDDHIEADNRLSWFVGTLVKRYPDALFVSLTRDPEAVVGSYRHRFRDTWAPLGRLRSDLVRAVRHRHRLSIVDGFAHSIVYRDAPLHGAEVDEVLRLFVETVNDNVDLALEGRHHLRLHLETLVDEFPAFWDRIGAEGDLAAALDELRVRHNATGD
jgi:hypothetical protein